MSNKRELSASHDTWNDRRPHNVELSPLSRFDPCRALKYVLHGTTADVA